MKLFVPSTFFYCLGSLFFGLTSLSHSEALNLDFDLANKTGYGIKQIYVSPATTEKWGPNILKNLLQDEQILSVSFSPEATASKWDLKIVWVDEGEPVVWKNLQLNNITKISLFYDEKNDVTSAKTETGNKSGSESDSEETSTEVDSASVWISSALGTLLVLAFSGLLVASLWVLFQKAGQPGWAALIPIYNFFIMIKVAQKPAWWIILFFIPFANIVLLVLLYLGLAKSFGKGAGFGLGILFLPFIFLPILAFGKSRYSIPPKLAS